MKINQSFQVQYFNTNVNSKPVNDGSNAATHTQSTTFQSYPAIYFTGKFDPQRLTPKRINFPSEKEKLVTFYSDNYSYDFLNQIYVEEEDIGNLFNNIVDNCRIELIEEYSDYIKDAYNDQILSIYYDKVLKDARDAKNISSYNLIINYLDLMLNYNNSFDKVKKIIEILKNKYYQRKLFMEKISEFEILHSLN
jgi:hypothetical protein